MKKRGIRVVIGGDYGFARTPQGENARDIAHFVRHLGYSPSEALVCATRYGAELMGLGDEAGQVREGFLADLLLVDGDPVADVGVLQHKERLVAILKGGEFTSWTATLWRGGKRARRSDPFRLCWHDVEAPAASWQQRHVPRQGSRGEPIHGCRRKFDTGEARCSNACISGFLSLSSAVSASIGAKNSWPCGNWWRAKPS